tara:strand:+ start:5929 stop:6264 length:336 start_codon:yes stop_codon:yes gene_type:complete
MPWFIKTESFTQETLQLLPEERQEFIKKHKQWVISLKNLGQKVSSGYLVNEKKIPGGGGLLIVEAKSFAEAKLLIEKDPMIVYGLVNWKLHQWMPTVGDFSINSSPRVGIH